MSLPDLLPPDLQDPALPYTAYAESLEPKRLPPGRQNLIHDPSLTHSTSTTFWARTNVTPVDEVETRWVGDTSAQLTVTVASTNSTFGTPTGSADTHRIPATAGTSYSAGARLLALPSYPNRAAQLVMTFRNSGGTSLGAVFGEFYVVPTTSFILLRLEAAVAPASTSYLDVRVKWWDAGDPNPGLGQTALTANDKFLLDGFDLHPGAQLDTVYVDGDQPSCAWDGTAHASTSTRTVPANRELPASEQVAYGRYYRGFGGSVDVSARIFRCDANNVRLEEISRYFLDGSVSASEDNEGSMWSFSGHFMGGAALEPYVDYVAPFLKLRYANGKVVDDGSGLGVQMGLYVVLPAAGELTDTSSEFTMEGRDLLWLLNRRRYEGIEVDGTGLIITDRVTQRLAGLGFPRAVIQPSLRSTGRVRTSDIGPTGADVCNDLLSAINYYPLTPDRVGRLTSFKKVDLMQREVNAYYLVGDENAVLGSYQTRPATDIYNHVIVYKDDKDNPFRASVKNTDPSSPSRVSRIGLQSLPPINLSEAESQQDVDDEAAAKLQEQAAPLFAATFETLPEPWHNLREVYYLHLKRQDGSTITDAYGRFWCKGWTIDFTQESATMKHDIYRLHAFDPTIGD